MKQTSALADTFDLIGHDLKSPLGILYSSFEVMRDMLELDPTLLSVVDDALDSARYQGVLIDNMVDYFRLELGEFDIQYASVDLKLLFDTFSAEAEAIAAKKGIHFSAETFTEAVVVSTSESLLRRVWWAILENSFKFCTPRNRVHLSATRTNEQIVFDICDDGRPILADYEAHLFDYGMQYQSRMAGSRASLGLNLPFAHAAVTRLDGALTAHTDDEDWTHFTIQLNER